MSKIHSLTIVNMQGINRYTVGRRYNGLVLHEILDHTATMYIQVPHFTGYTEDRQFVFEAINAPVDIEYCED
jgi:hypothetical protein